MYAILEVLLQLNKSKFIFFRYLFRKYLIFNISNDTKKNACNDTEKCICFDTQKK
jgi:hypothetical protein